MRNFSMMKRTRGTKGTGSQITQRLWTGDRATRDLLATKDADLEGVLLQHPRIADSIIKADDDNERRRRFRISTETRDRHGDVVRSRGLKLNNYRKNPVVLFAHDAGAPPIGKAAKVEVGDGTVDADVDFLERDVFEFADTIFRIVEVGGLKATSIGFMPLDFARLENDDGEEMDGIDFKKSDLLEFSVVPVPANPEAVARCASDGYDMKPYLRWLDDMQDNSDALESLFKDLGIEAGDLQAVRRAADGDKTIVTWSVDLAVDRAVERLAQNVTNTMMNSDSQAEGEDRLCWNPQLSKAFDIDRERFEPATAELGLVARYLDCEVKELYQGGSRVLSARMGSFLSALDEGVQKWEVDDVRNLTYGDRERPPVHDVIQLNSTKAQDFLVDGTRFMRGGGTRLVLDVEPAWYGLDVTVFSRHQDQAEVRKLLGDTWQRALQLNFLKGEAFALSGEFLPLTKESWDDIFLSADNEKAVRRVVDLVNSKGDQLDNRGMMLLGPPGTGKTLSARVARNEAQCTFIWVSARDFYRAGAFGGIGHAFELARECSPSIVVFEDIDNWLSKTAIDLLKTEMDGLSQSKGIVTLLTTNFPERMPKALIDRPGRFHDVLHFNLPDETTRRRMLNKWLPDLASKDAAEAVKATEGYSGAHLYELARFVGIIQEEEETELSDALSLALDKLASQRELIDSIQLSGSQYEPPPKIRTMVDTVVKQLDNDTGNKGPISYRQAHPNGTPAQDQDAEWDGPGEIAAAEIEDLLVMSAWREDKDRDELNKSDFKLPHHKASGQHAVNFRGTTAAIAALNGARGGVDIPDDDKRGVYNHLARHIRDDFDEEPPELRWIDVQPLKHFAELFVFDYERCSLLTWIDNGLVDVNMLDFDWDGRSEGETPLLKSLSDEVDKQTFTIQSIAGKKTKWQSRQAFLDWAKDHGFRTDKVDSTKDFWRLRQQDPEDFERLRTLCINPNDVGPNSQDCRVQAVGGPMKEAEALDSDDRLMALAYQTAAAARSRDIRDGVYGRDLGEEAVNRLCRFEGFFQVTGGTAMDIGDAEPNECRPLDGAPTFARIIEDRNFDANKAKDLGAVSREDAETGARQIAEAQQDADLMIIIGESVGTYNEAPLYRDCVAWRWVPERGEAVRIPLGAELTDPVQQLCELAETVHKAGRVLSQANETRLRQALELLSSVLEQLGSQDPDEGDDDKSLEPESDDDILDQLLAEAGVATTELDNSGDATLENDQLDKAVDGDDFTPVIIDLVKSTMADAVRSSTRERISKVTGTVD